MGGSAGVVTLLFTDLVASTELLARLGDDAAEDLRRVHFDLLRTAISTGGGEEVKTLGDGLMVAFTSSLQAIRSAVAIQRATETHNSRHSDRPLRVRIGLHAGEPVQADDDYHGTAVVVAKRLCDMAEGGQILASELVRELVGSRGGFSFRSAGRLRLKGLPDPVAASNVEWQQPEGRPASKRLRRPPSDGPVMRGPRLVGREREMAILEEELRRAAGGEFRCVLLVGEAGVGKTRLGTELLAGHRDGIIGLSARAHSLGTTSAFGVWAEALERHLRALDAGDVERLCAGFLDDLAQLLRSVAAVQGRGPEREPPRSRLLEGLAVVSAQLAADRPLVVVIDDVHNADPSSLEALGYIAHSCVDDPLLVVLTARSGEVTAGSAAGEILSGLEQEGLLRRLPVGPLAGSDLRALAEAVAGQAVPDALVGWLLERSQGNPFFALALMRALLDKGGDLEAPALERLPESLAERVAGRLSHLDSSAVEILELLAVLGRRAELRSLVAVSGSAPDELAEILDQLVRARFVAEEERGFQLVYEISHPLVQEAVYDGIGAARRRRLHRQVGQALVSASRLGEAAPHFVRSAEPGDVEAVKVLRDAVYQAEQRQAFQESLSILAALADLLPAGDPRWADVADALTTDAQWVIDHRADVHSVAGIPALRAMDQALGALGDLLRQARVKLRLAYFLGWGTCEPFEAARVGREALSLFEQGGDHEGQFRSRLQLTLLGLITGDRAQIDEHWATIDRLADDARSFGQESIRRQVLRSVAQAGIYSGRFDKAHTAMSELIELARSEGDAYALLMNNGFRACVLGMEGRGEEAEALISEIKTTTPWWRETPLVGWQTAIAFLRGDYRLAVERGHEAMTAFPGRVSRQLGAFLTFAAVAAVEVGKHSEAERFLVRSRAAYGARDATYFTALVGFAEAALALRTGRREDGLAKLRQSGHDLADRGLTSAFLYFLLLIPEVADDAEVAVLMADELQERADRTGAPITVAYARLARAAAATATADRPRAAQLAAEAAELLSGLDVKAFLAFAFELLGRASLDLDRAAAVDALEQAAALFDACGATWRRDSVLDALRNLGSRGRKAAAATLGPSSLTERERDVAWLAAQGYSAREIGEKLFIGSRTVEGHLARAYAKLGVASKVELARRAEELGLGSGGGNA
jgi:class 3 adenylate cyclase/DNA-binding CsgD family transcriptional regulator